ncbi:MAG: hypothetical protein RLZZ505_3037 [Verrucomicrobiota bacterium]|jgi:hypothetical protein
MKTSFVLIFAACACLPAHANTPKKEPLVKYTGLWMNSPFTSKPPVVEGAPPVNPFEDFTLTGIAPVPGGHRITIVSKKNPEIKRVIEPGGSDEFKVVSVQRNPEKDLGTVVVLSSGSTQGSVTFEPELITLNAAPTAPVEQPGGEKIQPEVEQPPSTVPPPGMRQPRPRITPPPTPAANQQPGNQPSGERRDNRRR